MGMAIAGAWGFAGVAGGGFCPQLKVLAPQNMHRSVEMSTVSPWERMYISFFIRLSNQHWQVDVRTNSKDGGYYATRNNTEYGGRKTQNYRGPAREEM
jgi:hypothetical protein